MERCIFALSIRNKLFTEYMGLYNHCRTSKCVCTIFRFAWCSLKFNVNRQFNVSDHRGVANSFCLGHRAGNVLNCDSCTTTDERRGKRVPNLLLLMVFAKK